MRLIRLVFAVALLAGAPLDAALAAAEVPCKPFISYAVAAPAPRDHPLAIQQWEAIKQAVKTQPYRVLYLGDSITTYWDPGVWAANMAPRGVLNAGVAGDRTEHLRWRLDHGNLAGPVPKGVVLMIGTNDLGHGRPPAEAAEGVRQTLIELREKLPDTRILLLGLWPRGAKPNDWFREEVVQVNKLLPACADGKMIVYADIGGVLLEPDGTLSHAISPDLLHFSAAGYQRIVPKLDPLIDRLVGAP